MLTFLEIILWLLAGLPVLLVLVMLVAGCFGEYSHRRMLGRLAQTLCPRCGQSLGRAAIMPGQERWALRMKETRKKHPGVKLLTVAEREIECPSCGCRLYFYPSSEVLETESLVGKKDRA